MTKRAGLWIDRSKAVIVSITDKGEEIRTVSSDVGGRTRFGGGAQGSEDVRDNEFNNRVEKFYDRVIEAIKDAASLEIFGPGEAKGELEKRLKEKGYRGSIQSVETADKMTDNQVAARVRGASSPN